MLNIIRMKNYFFIGLLFTCLIACKTDKKKVNSTSTLKKVPLTYAKGFEIIKSGDDRILTIKSPYPNAKEEKITYKLSKVKTNSTNYIKIPLQRIVATSTTFIPMLEYLGEESSLVGFPNSRYISSKKTRNLILQNKIKELGNDRNINTEVLLKLRPNALIGFSLNGNNKTHATIKKVGIPVILNNSWLEETPLGRAEWIKFFGVLFDKEAKADSIFNVIEKKYLQIKKIALKAKKTPTAVSGALFKNVWYLPAGESFKATFLKDANINYLWKDSKGRGSLSLNIESVFVKGKEADIWISPSSHTSLLSLQKANIIYTKFKAFKQKKVYSFAPTKGETGGMIYYELAPSRPDLVLKDLIKLAHPELLTNYEFSFYKKLE